MYSHIHARSVAIWLAAIIVVVLLALNIFAFIAPGSKPPVGVTVPFTQGSNSELFDLQCYSILLAPIAIGVWAALLFVRRRARWEVAAILLAAGIATLICVLLNYAAFFSVSRFRILSSVTFRGSSYYLAKYTGYDNPEEYYFGKCDNATQACVWGKFYELFMMSAAPEVMATDESNSRIVITLRGEIVYTYDGEHGVCGQPTYGRCYEIVK